MLVTYSDLFEFVLVLIGVASGSWIVANAINKKR